MIGSSILLGLICAVVLFEGTLLPNVNANLLNRQNYNTNTNTNSLGSSPKIFPHKTDDHNDDVPESLKEIRDKLYKRGNAYAARAVMAAAEAVMTITQTFVEDMRESTALGVAAAVGEILEPHLIEPETRFNRGSRNYNSNVNTNIVGYDRSHARPNDDSTFHNENDHISPANTHKLENSLGSLLGLGPRSKYNDHFDSNAALSHGVGTSALGYVSGGNGYAHAHGTLRHNDEDDGNEKSTISDGHANNEKLEHPDSAGSRTLGVSNWRNSNSNVNTNRLNEFRRDINRVWYISP